MAYVDAFIIPVPKKNLSAYKKMAAKSAKMWKKHGAVEYVESIAQNAPKGKSTSFPRSVKLKNGEVVALGFVVFKSLSHRNGVWKKLEKDQAFMSMWENMPFDGMRMIWGGFKAIASS
jgi:uncharacterized protein YbaA (DUF1428 family)